MTGSVYDTRDRLLELADTWPRLEQALGGIKGVIYDDMPKPASKERHLPINANISDLMAEIRDWAAFLARTVREERGSFAAAEPASRMDIRLRALAGHADWLTAHPELGDTIAPEAADWIQKANRQLDPTRRTKIPNATCWEPNCTATLQATINGKNSTLTCGNQHTLPATDWIHKARRPEVNA